MTQPLYAYYADLLETLGLAVCVFDRDDQTVHWNPTFLRFFPEHDGHVFAGEPYADNLRRFYADRLTGSERDQIERYVEEGLVRHRQQSRAFSFTHRGRRLQVGSLPIENGDRVRIWQDLPGVSDQDEIATPKLGIDSLEYIPDGVMVINADNAIIAANREFRRLYDISLDMPVVGEQFGHIVARMWDAADTEDNVWQPTVLNNLRYTGAPFEVSLPGDRWRRVIARQTADGMRYVTHSDITALKRQHKELQEAEARARASERALQKAHDALAAMAATDGLTDLANRRHFEERLQLEWKRARRDSSEISLLMIDIDRFKSINDRFGHLAGDACLRRVADIIREAVRRPADVAARYGGEEFAILLPNTGQAGALQVAETVQAGVRAENWTAINPKIRGVTLSIGIHTGENVGDNSMQDLVKEADALLYRAKRSGRNRIECRPADILRAG